jgi:hypothetical protein
MAAPFGGHPTLVEYIGWCNQQGCTTHSSAFVIGGRSVTCHRLTNPANGRHVIVVGRSSDRLSPTVVANYDRRLGLDSPFGKVSIAD